jgi:AcrR family transcriptional regulator
MTHSSIRRRAIRDEQKEERRQAILDTAWQLLQSKGYEALTMADVANTLGLAKGTVYLYFQTKEALFLALVEQQLTDLFSEFDAALLERSGATSIAGVINAICEALEKRPGLARLLAILHTILEQNISLAEATRFKYFLKQHFEKTGKLLEQRLPFLKAGEGAHLLFQCHALVIGIWQLADPAPVVQEALQQADLQVFKIDFAHEFSQTLQALLYGLEYQAQKEQR